MTAVDEPNKNPSIGDRIAKGRAFRGRAEEIGERRPVSCYGVGLKSPALAYQITPPERSFSSLSLQTYFLLFTSPLSIRLPLPLPLCVFA